MNNRKRAISIRMSATDIGNIKKLATRLGVRDSDVVRCAIKMMITKLAPLADTEVRGRDLVPVFLQSGNELFRYFELDAARLDDIINEGVSAENRVEHEDLRMLVARGELRAQPKQQINAIGAREESVE